MNKKLIAVLLAALLIAVAVVSSCAHTPDQQNAADALNSLGLFLGKGGDAGYALDDPLNRMEGVTLLVRMIGKENEAKKGSFTVPFHDVNTEANSWSKPYVGYAYANHITNGYGDDVFGATDKMTDYMFLTLTLRALGYSDKGADAQFTWDNPYELAESVGLIPKAEADSDFLRGDAVSVFWNAMEAKCANKDTTLVNTLIQAGVFSEADYAEARDIYKNGRTDPAVTGSVADTDPVTDAPTTNPPVTNPVQTDAPYNPPAPEETTSAPNASEMTNPQETGALRGSDDTLPPNMTPIG